MIEHGKDGAVNISAPLQKVDKENRLVSGFASLDNRDRQGDIVTSEAALKAFSGFRMNLREMHNNIAVGRVVDFKQDSFYDVDTDKVYSGVFVTAYVSKGAQDTWEKVLDGTLTGFSIGGRAKASDPTIIDGEKVRVVKDLELYELSLVDSPANQLANIITIQKNDGAADTATGIVADTYIKDVFYCKKDEVLSHGDVAKSCLVCGDQMNVIGWVEDTGEKAVFDSMKKVLSSYIEKSVTTEMIAEQDTSVQDTARADDSLLKNKGGNNMEKEVTEAIVEDAVVEVEKSVATAEVGEVTEVITDEVTDDVADELIEKAATNVEDEGVEVEVGDANLMAMSVSEEESSEVIKTLITDALESFSAQQTEAVTKAIAEVLTATEEKIEGLKKEIVSLNESLESRVEQVEGATAIKKSGELGGSTVQSKEDIKKGVWDGAFAPQRFFDSNSIVE